jgi:cytochrome d ubiquinol oxidase subunit I
MDSLILSRWQFAITTVYHFFFVPLTLGLAILVAVMETLYVRSGDEEYKRMVKFWGKLFVINFAMGVATGIVQEFQFGMNWSEYARFVGDVFGAPLAIEGLTSFFLESTFLGIWIFGWERLSKKAHLAAIWLVAIGSNLSGLWILIANSFMHEPVGYAINPLTGRPQMTDFGALVTNPHAWLQFSHVVSSGIVTASMFVLGISAYHLYIKSRAGTAFERSFRLATVFGAVAVVAVVMVGHAQGQHMVRTQPAKMAAADALWEPESPADLTLIGLVYEKRMETRWAIKIPAALSLMSYNSLQGEVRGLKDLQVEFEQLYGPGNYIPPVWLMFWSFRVMVGTGVLMAFILFYSLWRLRGNRAGKDTKLLRLLPFAMALPYLANTAGWLLTELGRQPWIVYGLQKTADAVSPAVPGSTVLFSLIGFTVLYAGLMAADVFLLAKYSRQVEILS